MAEEDAYSAPALEKGLDSSNCSAERRAHGNRRSPTNSRSKNEIFRMVHVLLGRGYLQREEEATA